ncbi:hypothetical protein [Paraburkholderia panacisoli]|uniref:hypothetical protein n=1 Tax=Paraburkholderia panacisoli TaxID=2603818 RepID=UPI001FE7308A|nr:hypothetical protein [Paraburkholderia panacisoli]
MSAVISPCGTYRYRLTRAAESLGLSMTNRAVDFAGANENGHYDGDVAGTTLIGCTSTES